MSGDRIWIFIDECGNSKFGPNGSRTFGLGAVATDNPAAMNAVVDNARLECWSAEHLPRGYFHANEDCWPMRSAFFDLLRELPIVRSDSVIVRKESVYESLRAPHLLYRTVARLLFRRIAPGLRSWDSTVVVASQWPAARGSLISALREAAAAPTAKHPAPWPEGPEIREVPNGYVGALQVADHVAWAANRRLLNDDSRFWEAVTRASPDWSYNLFRADSE